MDERVDKIIDALINRDSFLSLNEITIINNCSRRTVYYDIDKINELLKDNNIEELNVVRNKGIILDANQKVDILSKFPIITDNHHFFSPMERIKIIICTVLKRDNKVYVDDFCELCNVSRNTILNDIKVVQRIVSESDLNFIYNKEKGYYIDGNVVRKRSLFFLYFNDLYKEYRNGLIALDHLDTIKDYVSRMNCIENELGYEFVGSIIYSIAVFFSTINNRKDLIIFSEEQVREITITKEYELVAKYFDNISSFEKIYMTLHLLGSRLQSSALKIDSTNDNETYELACDLVEEFSRIANVEFTDRTNLEEALYVHLRSSLYRFKYGIQIGNPMLSDIKREYRDLFNVTKKATEYLEQQIALPISDAEIAYLTLHFGGAIKKDKINKQTILIVCPNGISTSKMLLAEIRAMASDNCQIDISKISDIHDDDYDIIISTIRDIKLHNMNKLIVVNPILSDLDRISIMKKCMFRRDGDLDKEILFNKIKDYINVDKVDEVKAIIFSHYNHDTFVLDENNENLTINNFIQKGLTLIDTKETDWKNAIKNVGSLLEAEGFTNEFYTGNIIKQLQFYGPYMFISENVILAHSKISDGSLKLGLALGLYPNGVLFERDRLAKLVIVLACEDQSSHLKILSDILTTFSDYQNIEALNNAKFLTDLLKIFKFCSNNKD